MNSRPRVRAAFGAAVALLLSGSAAGRGVAQDVGLPLGTVPAAATVEDLNGQPVNLADHIRNKPVLIQFWATWCPLCKALEPEIAAVKQKFGDDIEIIIMAVAVNQTPRQIRRHIENHPPPGRILYDAKGAAVRAFEAPTTSYIVILDRTGRVTYTGVGEDQRLAEPAARAVAARAGEGSL